MNPKIPLIALILSVLNNIIEAQQVATIPTQNAPFPGSDSILSTPASWGYSYLTVGGMLILSQIFSWILVGYISKRRIEEAKMRRTLLIILALGMGCLFGTTVVMLLPKAFGAQMVNYLTTDNREVDTYLMTPSDLSSLFLLVGFFFFLFVDLIARHFIAKTHMSTTRVPGISHSPAEIMKMEAESSRPPVISVIPGVAQQQGYVPNSGIGPIGAISTNQIGGIGGLSTGQMGGLATDPNLVRAERISTEPRSEQDLAIWRRKRLGEGTKKQSALILLREFIFSGFIGLTVGATFALYSSYNILAICLGLFLAHFFITPVDTALLYYVGFSFKKALLWNFLWNFIMFGTVAWGRGMAARGLLGVAYIFAAMSGIFLYLVLVHLMPALVKGKKYDLKGAYLLTFLIGTGAMFALHAIEN